MKLWRALLTLLVVTIGGSCWSDGGYFSFDRAATVKMPYQRAFVSYHNGVENLIVESTLNAKGGDYAWLIPTPSAPTQVKPCRPHTLSGLIDLTTPIVRTSDGRHTISLMLMLFYCLPASIYLIGSNLRSKRTVWEAIKQGLITTVCSFPIVLVLLPMLLTFKQSASGASIVHSQGSSGEYAYTVLSSSDDVAVLKWLDENGFKVSEASRKVIRQYCADHWAITALRYRHPNNGSTSPHPVRLTFKTDRPVYPMRLTGTITDALTVDLVVALDATATIKGQKAILTWSYDDWPGYRHPDILSATETDPFFTRFRLKLDQEEMNRDIDIFSTPGREKIYESWIAPDTAFNEVIPKFFYPQLLLLLWIPVVTLLCTKKVWVLALAMVLGLGSLTGLGIRAYCAMDKAEVERGPRSDRLAFVSSIPVLNDFLEKLPGRPVTKPFMKGIEQTLKECDKKGSLLKGDVRGGYELKIVKDGAVMTLYNRQCEAGICYIRNRNGRYELTYKVSEDWYLL